MTVSPRQKVGISQESQPHPPPPTRNSWAWILGGVSCCVASGRWDHGEQALEKAQCTGRVEPGREEGLIVDLVMPKQGHSLAWVQEESSGCKIQGQDHVFLANLRSFCARSMSTCGPTCCFFKAERMFCMSCLDRMKYWTSLLPVKLRDGLKASFQCPVGPRGPCNSSGQGYLTLGGKGGGWCLNAEMRPDMVSLSRKRNEEKH